ncbi:hypothetical protein MLD38_013907 [Melastoma candidum]|uniref:Uncharacterized protein n=1 Tax=Melastoma candidum TaxID=119954 RepID=A0ACB9RBP0_9MYRT|nr:hypothetical protein MLD38_013907 [Melastoma candidum]
MNEKGLEIEKRHLLHFNHRRLFHQPRVSSASLSLSLSLSLDLDLEDQIFAPFRQESMATKPMMKEAVALTEKKMDMALDDIIKMSKTGGPKLKKRFPNKSQRNFYNVTQQKSTRFKQYMNSRSSVRQGALAQRRSNFQGSQFPLTNEAAKRAPALPFRNGFLIRERRGNLNRGRNGAAFSNFRSSNETYSSKWEQQQQQELNAGPKQKPHTLDVLFASLKEQRLNSVPRRSGISSRSGPSTRNGPSMHYGRDKQIPPWSRGRFGK